MLVRFEGGERDVEQGCEILVRVLGQRKGTIFWVSEEQNHVC